MSKTIVLLSGGIDSMVAMSVLLDAKHEVNTCYVDFGQSAARMERSAAKAIADEFGVPIRFVEINLQQSFASGEVPFRNAMLVFAAATSFGDILQQLAIGVHAGVAYPDCSSTFLRAVDKVLNESSHRPIGFVAPLATWKKPEIIAYAVERELPLNLTYSCEVGGKTPCGSCLSCKDRADLTC